MTGGALASAAVETFGGEAGVDRECRKARSARFWLTGGFESPKLASPFLFACNGRWYRGDAPWNWLATNSCTGS